MRRCCEFFLFLAVILLTLNSASMPGDNDAGQGSLQGRIRDAQTGVALRDVNIVVEGSDLGTASAKDGSFFIKRVPAGRRTIKVTMIGYAQRRIELLIRAHSDTLVNIALYPDVIELEEVVTSAMRREQTVHMAPASVSLVGQSDIAARNAATFDQALETVPGLTVHRTIGVSVQALSLRGSSDVAGGGVGNRVMLAIDGRPALSSDSGGALWSLVPTNFIERVEVVKGAFSSLYGSTAMGGVINIITKRPANRNYVRLDVSGGFYELPPPSIRYRDSPNFFNTVNFSHSRKLGRVAYLLELSRKASGGHRQRSAYEFYNLYGKLLFDLRHNRNLELTLGADIGRNDYPHTWLSNLEPLRVAPKNTDNEQRRRTFSSDLHYYAIPNARVRYSSRFYFYQQHFTSVFNQDDPVGTIPGNESFGLFIRSDSYKLGNITQLDYHLSDTNYLIAGLDFQRDWIDAIPDTILYGHRRVNNLALYLQDEHRISDRLTLNLGLRYDYHHLEGGKTLTQLSPKAAVVYAPSVGWSVRFLGGRAFRAPSIAERFFQQEIVGGTRFRQNPDLRPETVNSFEIGSRFRFGDIASVDLALYHNTYQNMIYWVNLTVEEGIRNEDGTTVFEVQNLNEARMRGVELGLNVHPWRFLHTDFSYTYLDADDLSDVQRFGSLAYKVRHSFTIGARFQSGSWLLNFDGRYNSRIEEVFLYPNDKPDAFFVLNGKLTRRFGPSFTASAGVNNMFNIQYEELARYRMPGRTWIFGMSYEL